MAALAFYRVKQKLRHIDLIRGFVYFSDGSYRKVKFRRDGVFKKYFDRRIIGCAVCRAYLAYLALIVIIGKHFVDIRIYRHFKRKFGKLAFYNVKSNIVTAADKTVAYRIYRLYIAAHGGRLRFIFTGRGFFWRRCRFNARIELRLAGFRTAFRRRCHSRIGCRFFLFGTHGVKSEFETVGEAEIGLISLFFGVGMNEKTLAYGRAHAYNRVGAVVHE